MKRWLLIFCLLAPAAAQVTPNIGLNLPNPNSPNWNIPLNNNFSLLDSYLSAVSPIPALRITGGLTLSAVSGLTQCLHVNSSGLVTGSGSDCSSGAITGITTAAGSGLMGGGSSGTLTISLINSCSPNQVLQWDGVNWGCASVTGTGTVTTVTGTANQIAVANGTTTPTLSLTNPLITPGPVAIVGGSLVTDIRPLGITWTENASGTVFNGIVATLVDTAHAAGSKVFQLFGGAAGTTALFQVDNSGNATIPGTSTAGVLQAIGSGAGADILTQGTAPTCVGALPCWPVNSAGFYADTSIATTYALKLPSAGPSAPGFVSFGTGSGTPLKSALAFNTNLYDVGNLLTYAGGNGFASQTSVSFAAAATPGATYNIGNASCILASHQVGDCPTVAAGAQMVGILTTQVNGAPATIVSGLATVNSNGSQTWARAHIVCTDPSTAAVFVDNGTTPCPSGQAQAGIVAIDNTGSTHTIAVEVAPPSAGGFNSPMTTQGDIIYENATPTAARLAGPTSPDGVPQVLTEQSTSGSAGNPSWQPGGVPINNQAGTTYQIDITDRSHVVIGSNSSAQTYTIQLHSVAGMGSSFAFGLGETGTNTITLQTTSTDTINGVGSVLIPPNWFSLNYSNTAGTAYRAAIMPTQSAFPSCLDANGNHLNFNASTGIILCGTTSIATIFPVTVSGTVTSGGIPYFNSTTSESSSGILNTNILVKGGGAGGAPTNSSITDDGTTVTSTDTGGIKAPVFTTTGSTAGFVDFPQGSTSAAVAPCNAATSICEQAPASVTSYLINKPGAAASGLAAGTNNSGTITQNFTGSSAFHVGPITIGSGSSISATLLCSTTNCPAGDYDVAAYVEITTQCTTTGSYIVWLGWTDDGSAKTGSSTTTFFPFPLNGSGVPTTVGTIVPAAAGNYAQAHIFLHTTGAATSAAGSINYGTTATACGSGGPMVGKMFLTVVPLS